ncbi:MAG: mannose-1-phosphate guanylyltransferase/mannose-6-phosphate isomerase [Desulfatibacillaceae bacterium]|nr:mannose-1-phosphate guanylyltransferase/mannose-6-phosphate isomerase [Desulfatibacillaceae bacterium]
MILPVILAGGSGTRLWPLSRDYYPKQLLTLFGEGTMMQETARRLKIANSLAPPLVLCNESHRFFVAEQFRLMGEKPGAIILEPLGKNTAPAVAVAAIKACEKGEDPVLVVLPADHFIENPQAFHKALEVAVSLAKEGYCATFGIVPDGPETGYGYIQRGQPMPNHGQNAFEVARFVEKPAPQTAKKYLETGQYYWNSGMFVFTASSILEQMRIHAPQVLEACTKAVRLGIEDLDFFRLDEDAFSCCPSISLDYAVMEKTENACVVPVEMGWSDLGSWEALWKVGAKDDKQNVISGDVCAHDVTDCVLRAESRLLAAVGLSGHVVVETSDAVLVAPRSHAQQVRHVVERLREQKRGEVLSHKKVLRPWGSYEVITEDSRFQVKRLVVKPGARLSLQKHYHRAEHWVVVRGTGIITCGEKQLTVKEDESAYIPLGTVHRLENPGSIPLEIVEVQTGAYLGEDDIVRVEDDYGR